MDNYENNRTCHIENWRNSLKELKDEEESIKMAKKKISFETNKLDDSETKEVS